MTYDFRANQVRLNRIISSGSIPIIIYASSSATDLQGGKNFPDPGSDVFLFVSGSSTAKTLFGGDVVVSGSLTASIVSASQLTGSLQNITTGVPYLVGGTNITLATSSIGQITITSTAASSGGGDVSASYVVMSPTSSLSDNQRVLTAGNGIRLTDSGSPSGNVTLSEAIWIEQTNIFATTTSSIGIKTTEEHIGVDLFISGSDTTGFGANLVLYSDLSNFGLPRLVLSSSSGSLGGLIGYDNDISGLVDGINIDIPSTRNFGFRIGGGTPATTVDSAGNLNVRSGSASTGYFDVVNTIVGIGTATPNATYNASATRLVLKDSNSDGSKYQLFLSNEYPGTYLNSGIAFAFGPSNVSGAIYAKSNTTGNDRKGLNALIPTGNSFSWRTTGAHLGELTDSGNLIISGSVKAYTGFTGSLSGTIGGLPFLIGGPNITASYNSLGQWEISSSGGVASDYFFSRYANIIEASGSLYLSGALRTTTISASHGAFITGSFVQGVAGNEASGTNSHAEGYQTHALGDAAHSEGNNTIASNSYAHSEGINTTASGLYSHAEGNSSDASDDGAHAEGYNTTASGQYSHSEGYNSIASARGSHGEGEQTFATGIGSHAEGSGSVAYGEYSHAGGENTNAIGNSSQTGGNSTIASGSYQTVFGQYNTRNNTSSLFVVGNGTGDGDAFRHDILRVNSSSVEVSGSLTASAVVAGGVNITPITASLVIGGDGVNRASGSISGLFESGSLMTPGTIGKFDVEILAMSYGSQTGASWKYTATALWPSSGNFSFLATTELAAEYGPTAGLYNPAAEWDVNFNSLGQIELTGSALALTTGGTSFYVQVTKKMVATYGTILA